MARGAAAWLIRKEFFARTVTIKVRYDDFTTITRSHSDAPTRDETSIVQRAVALLDKTEAGRRPIRLLGASVSNLSTEKEPLVVREPRLPFDEIVNHESRIKNASWRP
jgi:DNA polymerase-4